MILEIKGFSGRALQQGEGMLLATGLGGHVPGTRLGLDYSN